MTTCREDLLASTGDWLVPQGGCRFQKRTDIWLIEQYPSYLG